MACEAVNDIGPGKKWMRVVEIWGGVYPNITRAFFTLACMHCGKATCIKACPAGAISKRDDDGIVVVDRDKCIGRDGCRECFSVCPYGVPQFSEEGIVEMCDFCTGIDIEPACMAWCPTEALKVGALDDLLEIGKGKRSKRMGGPTEPSVIIAGESPVASSIT